MLLCDSAPERNKKLRGAENGDLVM